MSLNPKDDPMLRTWRFTIPLPPHGKGRGRAFRAGKSIRVVTPAKTRSYEAAVAEIAREAIGDEILKGPLAMRILAVFDRPQRLAKVYKATGDPKFPAKCLWAPTLPDADNISKAVCDGAASVMSNDKQVVALEVVKVYAEMRKTPSGWACEAPKVVVEIRELDGQGVAFYSLPNWAKGSGDA